MVYTLRCWTGKMLKYEIFRNDVTPRAIAIDYDNNTELP